MNLEKTKRSLFGPGFLVTAAFVGPGTIATASQAGSGFGYALVWAVLFSVIATFVLQEMTARLGVVTGNGLGASLRSTFATPALRWLVFTLVITAILFGNTAYQAGNITGAAKGLSEVAGFDFKLWAIPIAIIAWILLMMGRFQVIQNTLIAMVFIMSLLFVIAAIASGPDLMAILGNAVIPNFPPESLTMIIALIGTTVVPYNLFLHSSSAAKCWGKSQEKGESLKRARLDTLISILVGGAITLAILVSATTIAMAGGTPTRSIGDIANQLKPVLGSASSFVFGAGLFAAGLTSAITAPLAAAFATSGCLGWSGEISDKKFRITFSAVLVFGLVICLAFDSGVSPQQLIILAQFANGLLLPLIAIFLLIVMNNRKLLGNFTNRVTTNVFGTIIILLTAGLGCNQIFKAVNGLLKLFGVGDA